MQLKYVSKIGLSKISFMAHESQLQSPGVRPGGQIMGLIPPNIKHKDYFAL